ncbi:MAG: site-specific integrase, partial [SAR324 cluster bacterium]|nr:site-specific integrase [SAR324 cluster bacterium]
ISNQTLETGKISEKKWKSAANPENPEKFSKNENSPFSLKKDVNIVDSPNSKENKKSGRIESSRANLEQSDADLAHFGAKVYQSDAEQNEISGDFVERTKNQNLAKFGFSQTPSLSFAQTQQNQKESIWQELSGVKTDQALNYWLGTLNQHTARSYKTAFSMLEKNGFFRSQENLQSFALVNHEEVIDEIKLIQGWEESTKQARAAAYISFTNFLQRRTKGIIHKAVASKEGNNKTFFKIRDKVKTNPLSKVETKEFLTEITKLNQRDGLIAKLILQGGKRKGEVLSLQIEAIDFKKRQIRFRQSKTKGAIKETIIHIPVELNNELKSYCEGRSGQCFITRNGKPVLAFQLDRNFLKAGEIIGVSFPVTPHVLRVTLVTRLKEMGVQDSDIMKITGHASPAQLIAYDRSDQANNITQDHSFI